jgi:hypothetical protein
MLLLVLFAATTPPAYGQVATVATDTITNIIGNTVPFDQPFVFKYKLGDKSEAFSVEVFPVNKVGEFASQNALHMPVLRQMPNGDAYFLVKALEPNKRYLFYLTAYLKAPEFQVIEGRLKDPIADWAGVEATYNLMRDKYISKYTNPFSHDQARATVTTTIPSFNDYRTYLNGANMDVLLAAYALAQQQATNAKQAVAAWSVPAWPVLTGPEITALITHSKPCDECGDSALSYPWSARRADLVQLLLDPAVLEQPAIYSGEQTLASLQNIAAASHPNWDSSASHLANTYSLVGALRLFIQYCQREYGMVFTAGDVPAALSLIETSLATNLPLAVAKTKTVHDLDSTARAISKQIDSVATHFAGFALPIAQLSSSSYSQNFDTRAGFYLQADVGFLAYRIPADPHVQYGFAPYLGFHANFRPLNTDLSFKLTTHLSFWQRLSFNAGVCLTSFSDSGKHTGLIGSAAMLTGLGYAFGPAFRITGGVLWYRKEDPDPLISHETTAAMPYIGLSIDVRLKPITNTFKQFFNL